MKLSYYINLILELEKSPKLSEEQSFNIDGFDTAVLILDDILDQSKIRDGKPCFYIQHGIDKAKKEVKILQQKAFKSLVSICNERNIGVIGKLKAKFLLRSLRLVVNKGQKIDYFLENSKNVNNSYLNKYNEMIRLFTGGHIKYSFLLGFLFSKNSPQYKSVVISIGEKIGVIRQIYDDLQDYKKEHHEPLGDLIHSKKRLPELLFLLHATENEMDDLNELLKNPQENFSKINELIFNEKVNLLIKEKIDNIKKSIEDDFDKLPSNYRKFLHDLLKKFYE